MSRSDPPIDYAAYRESEAPSDAEVAQAWAAIERRVDAGDLGPWLPDERPQRSRVLLATLAAVAAAAAVWVALVVVPEHSTRSFEPSPSSRDPDAASFDAPSERRSRTTGFPTRSRGSDRRTSSFSASSIRERVGSEPFVVPPIVVDEPSVPPEGLRSPVLNLPAQARGLPPAQARGLPPAQARGLPPAQARGLPPAQAREADVVPALPAIDEELALLQKARRSLSVEDHPAALRYVREHARRFEKGVLEPERQMLEVQVLCAAGRLDDARRIADRYVAANPASPWVAKLRRACPSTSGAL